MEMPMDLTEVKLRRKDVFEGKIMTVHVDDVRLPNGEEATREVVDHVDGAAVLALDEANRVLVVRQYRYVFGKVLDELPAGKLDPGEDPVTGALRELKEETGAEPETFLPLGKLLPAPGCYGETLHLFLAKGLKFSQQQLDPDEFLNVERVPFDEMVHRCVNGEIDDAKTVAAVLRAKDCVMTTVTRTKENCGDILADAKAINEGYAAEAETVEDTSAEG